MADVLQQIRAEHRGMGKLLGVLERQIVLFRDGGAPDYDIIEGVADYFLDYPDRVHHPKEDLVASRLIERAADDAGALRKLEEQHERLALLTRRFADYVRRVLDEAELPRDDFVRAANEFIAAQRHHMQMEEEHFLPVAEGMLSPGDRAELSDQLFRAEDPLMDPAREARFAALREAILEWEASERPD